MVESAKLCVPRKKKTCKKPPTFSVKSSAIQNAVRKKQIASHNWKINDRPDNTSNFFLLEKKLTTVKLIMQIRIALAKYKYAIKESILDARQSDNALFHKLIRKQRAQCHHSIDELHVGNQ